MSQRAIMLAARDHLRNLLALGETSCDTMFDGMPYPMAGETFVAIHPGNWTGESEDSDLSENFSFFVTVTRRLGFVPFDRALRETWAKATEGIEAVCRKIIIGKPVKVTSADYGLHMNYTVMNAANTTYITASYSGFHEPVRFLNGGQPTPRGPDWFTAETHQDGKTMNAGISQTLTFGQAKRVQGLIQHGFEQS
jgi:hypothetical protein